jgi:uncharacterized membrane protein YfcA
MPLYGVHELAIFAAAVAAGAINAVAGGGTLVTVPVMIWLGIPAKLANTTNAVALWPGSLASAWGYRRELRDADRGLVALVVPSLAGGILGAMLLEWTPTAVFDRLIPALIFFATCLFMAQEPVQRRFNLAQTHRAWAFVFQFGVGIYGGYFGAGIGILMLAALGLLGYTNIHQMNGVKNLLATCINGVASAFFVIAGLVLWSEAAVMAAGAVVGGVGGAHLARRASQRTVRRIVVAIGFGMAVSLMLRLL